MRSRAAIVGVGDVVPKRGQSLENYWELATDASLQALDDAGMRPRDIDGVVFSMSGYPIPYPAFPTNFCQMMGIGPAWMETTPHGGHQMGSMIWRAVVGIVTGMARRVLIVSTDNRQARRMHTQLRIIRRTITTVVVIVGISVVRYRPHRRRYYHHYCQYYQNHQIH